MAKKVKEPKEKHTLRTVLIVIVVILIIGIIGGSTGNDDENETAMTSESAVITEVVTEAGTESGMTVEEAVQNYIDNGSSGIYSKASDFTRKDLISNLSETYPESEISSALINADADWNNFALEYANSLLKSKDVYHEADLRQELADKDFTEDEIAYAIENADWTLQNDILDFVTEYDYNGIEENSYNPSEMIMFWNVYVDDDFNSSTLDETDMKEVAIACMQQPESKEGDPDEYSIAVYDEEGHLLMIWNSYDDKYVVSTYLWDKNFTNAQAFDFSMSRQDYTDIVNARKEQ